VGNGGGGGRTIENQKIINQTSLPFAWYLKNLLLPNSENNFLLEESRICLLENFFHKLTVLTF
jgi:hypothetical protein